ncbi:MAG: signal peptidase II [Alphaproteobacteria bacterium]
MNKRRWIHAAILLIVCLSVLLDQGMKWLVVNIIMQPPDVIPLLPFLNLRLGFNTGVSFGLFNELFADAPVLLASLMFLIVGGLAFWAWRAQTWTELIGLSLVIGGALGNIIDRLRLGAVVDFLDLHAAGWHWPTFNTADIGITAGAALLLLSSLSNQRLIEESAGAPLR